jgi:hypothetical protein
VFFKYLLGRVRGEDWADDFFDGKIKSGAVSGETLRRWSRTLECYSLVAQFIVKLREDSSKSTAEFGTAIDEKELGREQGYKISSTP